MPAPTKHFVKTFNVEIETKRADGGRIVINTGNLDRQHDRVLPMGARLENYQKNPIVQFGHNYRDPFATIGRTTSITKNDLGLVAEFELRPPANDQDPQHIVKLLWEGGWIKTASIGFVPMQGTENSEGGYDFSEWELLEWSLVPVPANAEALRLAIKSLDAFVEPDATLEKLEEDATTPAPESMPSEPQEKSGRVLSAKNEQRLAQARDLLNDVLAAVQQEQAESITLASILCPHCGTALAIDEPGNYSCSKCQGMVYVIDRRERAPTLPITVDDVQLVLERMTQGNLQALAALRAVGILTNGLEDEALAKGAIPPHTTPKADEDTPWSAASVLRALPNERAKLRLVHAWVDPEGDPDAKGSYKLPHHLADGKVVWKGVAAAGAALQGGRGGVNIPQSDVAGVRRHLARHYAQFDKTPPWEAAGVDESDVDDPATEMDAGEETYLLTDHDERALVMDVTEIVKQLKEAFA
jgi:HK97 family phage prohead protease